MLSRLRTDANSAADKKDDFFQNKSFKKLRPWYWRKPHQCKGLLIILCIATLALSHTPQSEASPKRLVTGLKDTAWVDPKESKTLKILAQNDHDLFFLWGYYHASDRFFQMDVSRRQIQGELAPLLGEESLPEDFRNRMLGIKSVSERTWKVLDARTQNALTAYSAGVNAFLKTGPLPAEYDILNLTQARPWTPLDSIAVMKGIVIHLSLRLDTSRSEILQHYIQAGLEAGFDGEALFFEDTHPIRPITAHTTYATAGLEAPYGRLFQNSNPKNSYPNRNRQTPQADPQADRSMVNTLVELRNSLQRSSFWRELYKAQNQAEVGSNWWAISGKHSQTGYPIIASDPHLSTPWPGVFYDVHLRITKDPSNGHLHAAGASFPGVPAIAHGQNEHVLWASTNNNLDASDVFLDTVITASHKSPDANATAPGDTVATPTCTAASGQCIVSEGRAHPIVFIPQTYQVNTANPNNPDRIVTIDPPPEFAQLAQVPFRTYGPLLKMIRPSSPEQPGQALVLQYAGFAATKEIMSFLHWLRAETIGDFEVGLTHFEAGSQNWLVTDSAGDLAYFSSAKVPLRKDLEAGSPQGHGPAFIRNGDGDANWLKPTGASPSSPSYLALPNNEMPRIVNPPSGILINANNDPTGQTLDGHLLNQTRRHKNNAIFYLNHGYADGLRAQHITDRLTALTGSLPHGALHTSHRTTQAKHNPVTPRQMRTIQSEAFQQDAIYLYPHLSAAAQRQCSTQSPVTRKSVFKTLCQDPFVVQALETLSTWDYSTPTGIDWAHAKRVTDPTIQAHSQAALYYHLWRAHLIRNLIYKPLHDHALPEPSARLALRALIHRLNQQPFSCKGASGLDFCGQSAGDLSDEKQRDFALLDTLIDVGETLASETFQAHLTAIGLEHWVWGAAHRQKFRHRLADLTQTPFSVPDSNFFNRYLAWDGFPRTGGYEVVDAAPVPADAITLDALVTEHGAARRVVGGMTKGFFRRGMRSTAVIPTARRANETSEAMITDWVNNNQNQTFDAESFMRLRWEKHIPSADNIKH